MYIQSLVDFYINKHVALLITLLFLSVRSVKILKEWEPRNSPYINLELYGTSYSLDLLLDLTKKKDLVSECKPIEFLSILHSSKITTHSKNTEKYMRFDFKLLKHNTTIQIMRCLMGPWDRSTWPILAYIYLAPAHFHVSNKPTKHKYECRFGLTSHIGLFRNISTLFSLLISKIQLFILLYNSLSPSLVVIARLYEQVRCQLNIENGFSKCFFK